MGGGRGGCTLIRVCSLIRSNTVHNILLQQQNLFYECVASSASREERDITVIDFVNKVGFTVFSTIMFASSVHS